uniref:CCDC22 coiled-coil domain-containing protein n=1 Tax=Kalanchoe fedtschenkoi TaxID=63787 RepID=A0A7N0VL06_KALFE
MEDGEDILLRSLESFGVSIPHGVTSVKSLTPDSLFTICSQSLRVVDHAFPFPESLPQSTTDRFRVCKDIALVMKEIGYLGDISFHQFLYPSKDDLYKLVRFLIEKLSTASENGAGGTENEEDNVASTFKNLRPKFELLHLSKTKNDGSIASELSDEAISELENQEDPLRDSRVNAYEKAESPHLIKTGCEVVASKSKRILNENVIFEVSNLEQSEEHQELLNMATEMAFDDQHQMSYYTDQLTSQIDAKRSKLVELKSQWEASIKPLEVKRKNLIESLNVTNPSIEDKYQKLKQVELQMHSVLCDSRQRAKERVILAANLEKLSTLTPRNSYVQRINEITKNSRKQDADIERILKETRELQLESNSTQERLHRTYAITSETLLRDAKTNPVGQQAYKLVNNIHENFEQISEEIHGTDRLQRDIAELEKKLESMASQSLHIDKLQADIDAIRKENEALLNP